MADFRRQLSRAEVASLASQRTPKSQSFAGVHANSQLWSNERSQLRVNEMIGG